MLSALAPSGTAAEAPARMPQLAIGIGPVRIPEYLDRRNLIVRNSINEYEIVELAQWAEPLADTLGRVLADNLSVLLGTQRILQFPWRPAIPVDCQLAVQVVQFYGSLAEQVVLRAYWLQNGIYGFIMSQAGSSTLRLSEPLSRIKKGHIPSS